MKEMILWVMDVNKDVLELQLTVFYRYAGLQLAILNSLPTFSIFPELKTWKWIFMFCVFQLSFSRSQLFFLPVIFQRNT